MTEVAGRDRELAAGERFAAALEHSFAALVFEGDAGIGKTTVWSEVIREAERRGFRALSCRAAEAEAKVSLTGLADLLGDLPDDAYAFLPPPQRHALDVALLRADPGTAATHLRTLGTAVRSLLASLASERPVLIAVDDVQWLDSPSARVLEFVVRRLSAERIGLLVTRRVGMPAPLAVEELAPGSALSRVGIGPLAPAALRAVLAARLERPLTRPRLLRLHEASAGNPFFALEIARALEAEDAAPPGGPLPVPENVRRLVAGRILRLPPGAREALLAAATLSHPTVELVEHATSAADLAAAEEAGLVRVVDSRVVLAHPLYGSAVYSTAATTRVRRLHRRLAGLVADPEERARHLGLATERPDEAVASTLESGAAHARARGAWDAAAELLERARLLTPADRPVEARRRAVAAAEHHVRAGDRPRGRSLLEEIADEELPGPLRADALRVLAEISLNDENTAEAKRLFAEALRDATPAQSVVMELGLAYVHALDPLDHPAGRVHAYRALEWAEQVQDRDALANALAFCSIFDWMCARGVDWARLERSLSLADRDSDLPLGWQPRTIAALLLLYVGRHAEARTALATVREAAANRGDESDVAFLLIWMSWLETRSGDLSAAVALADESAALATLTGGEAILPWTIAQRAWVHAHAGEVAEARELAREAAARAPGFGNALAPLWVAATLGLVELSLGDPKAAWAACSGLTEVIERHGLGEPVHAFFLPEALEALVGVGELDRAERLVDLLEERGRVLDRTWALATGARCRGLLRAARGDLEGATRAFERALAVHEGLDMPFDRARTLLCAGVVQRRRRRRAGARESFEQALAIFEQVGARLWAERARGELRRTGLRRSPRGELTEAELGVAELAARGLTNREVAAALSISPKTVEAALSRVYAKLGIHSRAELGARMGRGVER